jgi:hypothetical protein
MTASPVSTSRRIHPSPSLSPSRALLLLWPPPPPKRRLPLRCLRLERRRPLPCLPTERCCSPAAPPTRTPSPWASYAAALLRPSPTLQIRAGVASWLRSTHNNSHGKGSSHGRRLHLPLSYLFPNSRSDQAWFEGLQVWAVVVWAGRWVASRCATLHLWLCSCAGHDYMSGSPRGQVPTLLHAFSDFEVLLDNRMFSVSSQCTWVFIGIMAHYIIGYLSDLDDQCMWAIL